MKFNLNKKRVLVLKLQGLGDTVLQLPMIRKLLVDFPRIKLDIAVMQNGSDELIRLSKFRINRLWIVKKGIINYVLFILKIMFRYYIIILPYKSGKKENLAAFLSFCTKRTGYAFTDQWHEYYYSLFDFFINMQLPVQINRHYIIQNLDLAEFISHKKYTLNKLYPEFKFSQNDVLSFLKKNRVQKYIIFHLGAGDQQRLWDINNYISLIKKIIKNHKQMKIILVGKGRKEEEHNIKVMQAVTDKRVIFFKTNFIKELLILISKALLVMGNDSGIMHLASLVDTAVLSIWGYTNYNHTAPAGRHIYIIRKKLACSPCYRVSLPVQCQYKNKKCLEIPVKDVWKVLQKVISKKPIKSDKLAVGTNIINI